LEISPVRNIFALLAAGLLASAAGSAAAQELVGPGAGDAGDLPPALETPQDNVLPSGEAASDDDAELIPQPMAEGDEEHLQSFLGDPMHALHLPSYFESSGTWLRRGFWFVEADYVMMNRSWDRKGMQFAFEGGTSLAPGFQQPGLEIPGFGQILAINELRFDGSKPGGEGLARVKIGRFLFRDFSNRDHTAEFSFYGGARWAQEASLEAIDDTPDPPSAGNPLGTGIQVNNFIDREAPSFDGADSLAFEYETEMNSIEGNYVVKSRMSRDQMQLRPSGEWVRVAQPTRTYSFLAGMRYMKTHEELDIDATGVLVDADEDPDLAEDGFYNVDTDNDLSGGQLGASIAYETARWSIGASVKGGAFWNRMDLDSQFQVGETVITNSGITDAQEDNISFIGEFQFLGKWHLRPNLSLRAGFEVLFVDSIALAPYQVNFIPGGFLPIADDGDIVGMGSSLGIEYYH
jgi:hypothetical protein